MPDAAFGFAAFGFVGQGRLLVVKRPSLGDDAVIEGLKTPDPRGIGGARSSGRNPPPLTPF
jgi:hypothetical protein